MVTDEGANMKRTILLAALITVLGGGIAASQEDAMTSLSYISYLERYATLQPAQQEGTQEAVINMPIVAGDRLDTAREARAEVVLADGSTVWIDEYTTVSFDAVAYSRDTGGQRTVLFLAEGALMVQVPDDGLERQPTRIDGPNATVYLTTPGLYRVDRMPAGGLRLEAWQGLAEASTTGGGVLVRAESAAQVNGGDVTGVEPNLTWGDDFARWVELRRRPPQGESLRYVDAHQGRQAAQLDSYGSWIYVDAVDGWAWRPDVASGWSPYTAGRWYWTPVGWSWLSYEPWGWLPYHYGSWYFSAGFGWVWTAGSYWSPAWVHWMYWPGYVGWCPAGYYDWWYWDRYGGYWPGHPGHGGRPGPPRGDVIPPPRSAGSRLAPGDSGRGGATARLALDLEGHARVAEVDRQAWNVVAADDFASPHLARLVRPGEEALRGVDQVAVVRSGALRTAPPSQARPAELLDRSFRATEPADRPDLSGVLARRGDLPEAVARQADPTTIAAESVRSVASAGAVGPVARPQPTLGGGPAAALRQPAAGPVARTDGPTDRVLTNPFHSRIERQPVLVPSTSSDGGRSVIAPSGALTPRTGSVLQGVPPSGVPSLSSPSGSSSRPVIVPRTPTTRSGGTLVAPRSGGSSSPSFIPRSSSSSSSSARSPRASSGRSSASSAPRSSGGSRVGGSSSGSSGSSSRATASGSHSKSR